MATWSDINNAVSDLCASGLTETAALDHLRTTYISRLRGYRRRNVVCYYSGWLQEPTGGSLLRINDDDMNGLMNAVHGLDKGAGLDLVLHTPGGDLFAGEAFVNYLLDSFHGDVCAMVPHLAMSAGTVVACASREVFMGRQSSLGPTDPQLNGIPAAGVLEEFEEAVLAAKKDPDSIPVWAQIISQYTPTYLGDCRKAVDASRHVVRKLLLSNMLRGRDGAEAVADRIVSGLCDHGRTASHNRHFSYKDLREMGMSVTLMEDDDELQDAVLSVHHSFMATFQRRRIAKVVQSSNGKQWVVGIEEE